MRQINGSAGAVTGQGLAIGGLIVSGICMVVGLGVLASLLLPALAHPKAKIYRVKCVNNLGQLFKAGLGFAQNNRERLPWQLNTSGVRSHLDSVATASNQYGRQTNPNLNEVTAHPNSLAAAGVYGLVAMKAELMTPRILHSPCDATRADANEIVQENSVSIHRPIQNPQVLRFLQDQVYKNCHRLLNIVLLPQPLDWQE